MALGEYRGPESVRAFMRYALARLEADDVESVYRVYVATHLQLALGTTVGYYELVTGGGAARDFDAEKVVDDIASAIAEDGGEGE